MLYRPRYAQSPRDARGLSPTLPTRHSLPCKVSQSTCKARVFPIAAPPSPSVTTRAMSPRSPPIPKERDGPGSEVHVGGQMYRRLSVLGQGSYGKVWLCETIGGSRGQALEDIHKEVALKEVNCLTKRALDEALSEVCLLKAIEKQIPDSLQIPRCIAYGMFLFEDCFHRICTGSCLRMALTVCPGETLGSFLKKSSACLAEKVDAFQYACGLVTRLMEDMGKVFEKISSVAIHRDVNSHNIMIKQNSSQPTDVSFWLIDFGFAVDSIRWDADHGSGSWAESWCCGDVRYWPPSSWMMYLCGAATLRSEQDLCAQYRCGLDVYGLGITALEIICLICSSEQKNMSQGSEHSCLDAVLLMRWQRYWADVSRWMSALRAVSDKRGIHADSVHASLVREGCMDKIVAHIAFLQEALRGTIEKCPNNAISSLICAIEQMMNEGSKFGWTNLSKHLPCGSWESSSCKSPVFESPDFSTAISSAGRVHEWTKEEAEWLVKQDAQSKVKEELSRMASASASTSAATSASTSTSTSTSTSEELSRMASACPKQKQDLLKAKEESQLKAKEDEERKVSKDKAEEDAKTKVNKENMKIEALIALASAELTESIDQLEIAVGKGLCADLEAKEIQPALRRCTVLIAQKELRLEKEEEERNAKEEVERLVKIEELRLALKEEERKVKAETEQHAKEVAMAKKEKGRLPREEKERQGKQEIEWLAKDEDEKMAKEEAQQFVKDAKTRRPQRQPQQWKDAKAKWGKQTVKTAARFALEKAQCAKSIDQLEIAVENGVSAGLQREELEPALKRWKSLVAEEELRSEKEEQKSVAKAEVVWLAKEEGESKMEQKSERLSLKSGLYHRLILGPHRAYSADW